ncbi:glycosyltransferase [Flavobacteriaceae bacterium]|nr:glycosyltransferase [Flavobacteriaceae bacterium]
MKSNRKINFVSINTIGITPILNWWIRYLGERKSFKLAVYEKHIKGTYRFNDIAEETFFKVFENRTLFNSQNINSQLKGYWGLVKLYFRTFHKPDIHYTIDHQVLAILLILKKINPFPSKFKLVYHQLELVDIHNLGRLSKMMYNVLLRNTDEVSFYVFPEINRWRLFNKDVGKEIDSSKFYLLPNTCHVKMTKREKIDSPQLSFLNKIPKDAFLVGHVGNFGFNHYAEEVFEAINLLDYRKDIYFLFLGYKGSDLASYVEKHVKNKNVIIVDEIQHQYLDHVYQRIDLGMVLYKAIDNNFAYCAPNKLYEYWANGVPVIGSTLPGLKGVFNHDSLGELSDFASPVNIKELIVKRLDTSNKSEDDLLNHFAKQLSLDNHLHKLESANQKLYE